MPNPEAMNSLESKLAELGREQGLVKSQLDRERLTTITSSLIETITSPKFVDRMRQFRAKAGEGASFDDAADLMSLESLRSAGAAIPDDFRLTSRVFEDFATGTRIDIKPPRTPGDFKIPSLPGDFDPSGPVEWGACAGGGAASVCGCAGGGS